MTEIKQGIKVKGMVCSSCEKIVEKQVMLVDGVKEIKIDYVTGNGHVVFDDSKTDIDAILDKVDEKGYETFIVESNNEKENATENNEINNFEKNNHKENHSKKNKNNFENDNSKPNYLKWVGYGIAVLGIILVAIFALQFVDKIQLPEISLGMSYGLLFLVGLLTGFHCIAMCGSFVISYTAKNAQEGKHSYKDHLSYGAGKLVSYTVIGAVFGLIGSIITFTPLMRGIAGVLAGIFMIVFGLSMLNLIPILKKVRFGMPSFLSKFVGEKQKNANPLVIGLLNGLMIACGPLQAIYIMAAASGSITQGATMLFVFGLGTLPVMLGFGFFASTISAKMTHKILKFSGVLVLILGLVMLNTGLVLSGSGYDAATIVNSVFVPSNSGAGNQNAADSVGKIVTQNNQEVQEIKMDVLASGWSPNSFVLKKGVPVKWIINAKELTGCNNAIQVPKMDLNFKLKPGIQTINFTPTEEGVIPFSCWMGMIRGNFIVKSNIDLQNQVEVKKELAAVPAPSGGSCGGTGGGCGCGGGR